MSTDEFRRKVRDDLIKNRVIVDPQPTGDGMNDKDELDLMMLRKLNKELVADYYKLHLKLAELELEKFKRFNEEECWIYQEDGDNHLESLVCPVVISAQTLMDISAPTDTTEWISVEDRTPAMSQWCVGYSGKWWMAQFQYAVFQNYGQDLSEFITHWVPLATMDLQHDED